MDNYMANINGKQVVYLLELFRNVEWLKKMSEENAKMIAELNASENEEERKFVGILEKTSAKYAEYIEAGGYWQQVDGKISYPYIKRQCELRRAEGLKARVNRGLVEQNAGTWVGCEVIGWDK